jgi:hypothetical protein
MHYRISQKRQEFFILLSTISRKEIRSNYEEASVLLQLLICLGPGRYLRRISWKPWPTKYLSEREELAAWGQVDT